MAPRSVRSLPVALEPTTTSLPAQRFARPLVWPSRRSLSCVNNTLDWFLGQTRIVGRQTPVNVKIAVPIHRDDPVDAVCPAQKDFALGQIDVRPGEIEAEFAGRQHDSHVPDSLVGERLCLSRDARRKILAAKTGKIEVPIRIERHLDFLPIGSHQHHLARFKPALAQIDRQVGIRLRLAKGPMPPRIGPKRLGSAQNTVGIPIGGDVSQGQRIGDEQGGRDQILIRGQNYVARAAHLQGEELIGFHQAVIRH